MSRTLLSIALVAGVTLAPPLAQAGGKYSLKSVSIDLPPGDAMYPNEPGSEAMNNNCLACHSTDMILNQPAMSKVQWEAEVNKMRSAYKAPVDPKDVDTIVGYLVSTKGAK